MTLINKNDVNQIFAINAPAQDKPASFANYTNGWDTARSNNGRPTIRQFNLLQQRTDQNILWIHQNGATLPYDPNIEYADGAVVVKDGELQQKSGANWNPFGGSGYGQTWKSNPNGYALNDRVMLDNGDIVKSIVSNNTKNPNIDMTGWLEVGKLIVLNTVNEMINTKLKVGDVVKTLGYHNVSDSGGALYVISDTTTDYSISLSSGLNAIFCDDFDIRKFGIRNNETLDQTDELKRMVAYADDRVYEIDFYNYKIMTPKTIQYTNARGTVYMGMTFHKVHKIKNLYISNDKTQQLYQGTSCILFMPKQNSVGFFELENVTFDPYVPNHKLVSMDEDGAMHGFSALWYLGAEGGYPANTTFMSGYSYKFTNINFVSPAVSYNLGVGIFANRIEAKKMVGDYIGIYLVHHTNILEVQDVTGVYRDDLHVAGRPLVTNLVHEEAEIANRSIVREYQVFKNLRCTKKSTGLRHTCVKLHRIGDVQIKKITLDDVTSSEFYSGETVEDRQKLIIDHLICKNSQVARCVAACKVTQFDIINCNSVQSFMLQGLISDTVNIRGHIDLSEPLVIENPIGEIQNLNIDSVRSSNNTYGILRTTKVIRNIHVKRLYSTATRAIECSFDNLTIDNLVYDYNGLVQNFIYCVKGSGTTSYASILKADILGTITTNFTSIISATNTLKIRKFVGDIGKAALGAVDYSEAKVSVIFDTTYPSKTIEANTPTTTTVAMRAAKVGDRVSAVLVGDARGTTFSAYVATNGSITVVQNNPTAASVTTEAADLRLYLN